MVTAQALHAMGLDAVLIGEQQHVGDDLCLVSGEAELLEGIVAEAIQKVDGEIHMGHVGSHPYLNERILLDYRTKEGAVV